MKKLLLSAAVVSCLAVPASAQNAGPFFQPQGNQSEILASDLIGMRVYATENQVDGTNISGTQADWQDIGEVNDVVLSRDGKVDAVLVDIGGFLGIGERQVAVQMNALKLLSDDATADNGNDFFLVLNTDRATLEGAPAYGTMGQDQAIDPTTTKDQPADAAVATQQGKAPDGYALVQPDGLSVDSLQAAELYDSANNRIGEVSDLIVDAGGKITQVVVDVGGFLGVGEKRVSLPINEVKIMKAAADNSLRVYINQTEDQLKDMPAYSG